MSWCCSREQPEYKYEVKSLVQNQHGSPQESYKYFNSLEDVDHLVKENQNVSITKVKTQIGLNDLINQMHKEGQKFTDATFPPEHSSLGNIPGNITWKRIPELLRNQQPVIFDRKIEPSDVIAGHEGDCYLLSSLAALAQFPQIIKKIFRGQVSNAEGLYKVSLRVDGVVEEVVIDDFVPINENGQPVFCQPNRKTGQIWVVLLEKALAKVSGSYANLNEGIPSDIFRKVTYAPSESTVFSEEAEQRQKVWNLLKQYTTNQYPFCATTKADADTRQGLQSSHTYTVIAAEEVEGSLGKTQLVKLRNPWKEVDYRGIGNLNDAKFWNSIQQNPQKAIITSPSSNNCSYGLFSMHFQDFCRNFNQIHYCNLNSGGKFLSEELLLSNKACFFDVSVQRQGNYTFEINQAKLKNNQSQSQPHPQQQQHQQHLDIHKEDNHNDHFQNERPQHFEQNHHEPYHYEQNHYEQNHYEQDHHEHEVDIHSPLKKHSEEKSKETACRATILLIKKEKTERGFRYEFINGTMKYNETNTTITQALTPGDYVIYAKVDPSTQTHKFPPSATINLYSKNFATLQPVLRTKYPNLVHDALLDHALHNKRSEYNQGKVWMSWQLLFQKGGFAYLAGGNSPDSQQTVVISYNQEDFAHLNFKLKKPLKGHQGKQTLRIPPGQANIIIARVLNDPNVKSVKFPPKLDIKLEPIH